MELPGYPSFSRALAPPSAGSTTRGAQDVIFQAICRCSVRLPFETLLPVSPASGAVQATALCEDQEILGIKEVYHGATAHWTEKIVQCPSGYEAIQCLCYGLDGRHCPELLFDPVVSDICHVSTDAGKPIAEIDVICKKIAEPSASLTLAKGEVETSIATCTGGKRLMHCSFRGDADGVLSLSATDTQCWAKRKITPGKIIQAVAVCERAAIAVKVDNQARARAVCPGAFKAIQCLCLSAEHPEGCGDELSWSPLERDTCDKTATTPASTIVVTAICQGPEELNGETVSEIFGSMSNQRGRSSGATCPTGQTLVGCRTHPPEWVGEGMSATSGSCWARQGKQSPYPAQAVATCATYTNQPEVRAGRSGDIGCKPGSRPVQCFCLWDPVQDGVTSPCGSRMHFLPKDKNGEPTCDLETASEDTTATIYAVCLPKEDAAPEST